MRSKAWSTRRGPTTAKRAITSPPRVQDVAQDMVHKTWSKRNGPTDTGQEPEVVVQDGRAQAAPMTSAKAAPLPSARDARMAQANAVQDVVHETWPNDRKNGSKTWPKTWSTRRGPRETVQQTRAKSPKSWSKTGAPKQMRSKAWSTRRGPTTAKRAITSPPSPRRGPRDGPQDMVQEKRSNRHGPRARSRGPRRARPSRAYDERQSRSTTERKRRSDAQRHRAAQAPGDQDESAEAAPTSPMTRADVPTVALAWLFLATRNAALIMIPIAHHPDPGAGAIISLREPEELFGAAKDSRREGAAQGAEIVASMSQGARDRLPRDQRRGPRGGQKRGPKTWSIRRGPREVVQKDVVHDGVQDMVQVVVHETWSTRSGPKDVVQETGDMAQDGRAKALTKPRRCGAPKPLHYRAPRPLFYRAQKTLRCPAPEQHRPPATRTRAQKPLQRRR